MARGQAGEWRDPIRQALSSSHGMQPIQAFQSKLQAKDNSERKLRCKKAYD